MTGVEILAMEEVAVEFAFNWTAFFISFGVSVFFLGMIGLIISINHDEWVNLLIGIILGVVFGSIFGFLVGNAAKSPAEYEERYKVIISDEVSMNEFVARYEIIKQDGKIYTVAERD